jgi:tetratricopeptide (TPR) repeat protein
MRAAFTMLLAASLGVTACAARRPAASAADAPAGRARSLAADGCYRCLEEGLALVQPSSAASAAARATAFDLAVLLAARDRELGLLAADHLPAARALGGATPRDRLLLSVVEAMPWPQAALGPAGRDASLAAWGTLAPLVPAWHEQLAALAPGDLAARYLVEGVDCTWTGLVPGSTNADGTAAAPHAHGTAPDPPLVRARRALCDRPSLDEILALRQDLARWEELDLAAADAAMNGGALLTAERHYLAAWQAFPEMLPAAHGLARLHVMLEEYDASLPEYDAVLAAVPDQQDCLLGKARALSQLGRHADAIGPLDRLIALGTWLMGDAHYWRGWNRLHLGDVDGAASDAERALQLMVNARVHVLAGAVAARRTDWPRARAEFEAALPLDETDCDIPMSLGSVLGQQRDWTPAFTAYARAAQCLRGSGEALTRRLDEIGKAEMDEARRVRFVARTRSAIEAARRQEGQARYNAAVSLANLGRTVEAQAWAAEAAEWPEWRERALALLRR